MPNARLVPWAVLLVGLAATGTLYASIVRATDHREQTERAAEIDHLSDEIDGAISRQVSVLQATAGLIAADPDLDQRGFKRFYDHLVRGKDAALPASIGFSMWRPWARRAELEEEAVRRGATFYRLRPAGPRPEAHAVILLMPLDKRNSAAPGFDMHAEPIRRAAMDRARGVDHAVMTQKLFLANDNEPNKPAFILYLPVFRPGDRALLGFVYAAVRAERLFGDLFDASDPHVGLRLWSGARTVPNLVYAHDPAEKSERTQSFHVALPAVNGSLEAEVSFSTKFGTPPVIRPWVVPVGTALSLLLFLLASVLRRAQEASERREAEQGLLAEVGRLTSAGTDDDDVLWGIVAGTARTFDAICRVDLLEADGSLRSFSTRTENIEALAAQEREYPHLQHDEVLKTALATGRTQRVEGYRAPEPNAKAKLAKLGIGPMLIVPLCVREHAAGAITLTRALAQPPLSADAQTVVEAIAGRLALALDNARLYRAVQKENDELERRVEERTRDLEASNHELESFCYSVSHDLRTPLRSVDGFGRLLEKDYGDRLDAQGIDYVRRILAAARRMDELITALLTLSRLTRREIVPVGVDATAMVCDIMRDLDPEKKVRLEVEDGLIARADARMLAVVFDNLLSNAIKFSARREKPEIVVGRSEDDAIFVRDNGAGFDMAYAGKLFQPFERLHSVREFPGHGIGLATVERIVRRHGGEVRAEGRPGEGATFFIKFPD